MRPNILIISTHDTGCHFGCYDVPTVSTPNIDRLAREGVMSTNMFATASICSPSRGSLLTGRYPQTNGLIGLAGTAYGWEFNDSRQHLSHICHEAGYFTVLFGYQHETDEIETLGFDEIHAGILPGVPGRTPGTDLRTYFNRYVKPAPVVASEAAVFLKNQAAVTQPFYAQVGFLETHTPYVWGGTEPDDERGIGAPAYVRIEEQDDQAGLRRHIADLQGSVRTVDTAVGSILSALDASGMAEDTLVLFTVDHGPELPRAKWTMYDPGLRVAFVMRWPAACIQGGHSCDQLLSNIDFLPTLAELTDIPFPFNLEGKSFAGALKGGTVRQVRDCVFGSNLYGMSYAARTTRYKFIRNFSESRFNGLKFRQSNPVPCVELYDLVEDPWEQCNLAVDERYASVLAEMDGKLWQWLEDVHAPILEGYVTMPDYRQAMVDYSAWRQGGRQPETAARDCRTDGSLYTIETDRHRLVRKLAPMLDTKVAYVPLLQLYDLNKDPEGKVNVAGNSAYVDVVAEMDVLLWNWLDERNDTVLSPPVTGSRYCEAMKGYEQWRNAAE